jgi:hypothetical protein
LQLVDSFLLSFTHDVLFFQKSIKSQQRPAVSSKKRKNTRSATGCHKRQDFGNLVKEATFGNASAGLITVQVV